MDFIERMASRAKAEADLAGAPSLMAGAPKALPAELAQRLPQAEAHARAQMDAVSTQLQKHKGSLEHDLNALLRSKRGFAARYDALVALTEQATALVAKKAACRRHCAHCCHIPVALLAEEAELIGHRIHQRPAVVAETSSISVRPYGYDHPCPFLSSGSCSIYANRPMACRLHFNMDQDDLLCRLLPDLAVPVPLADMRQFHKAYVFITTGPLGDIRDFFPKGKTKP